MARQTKFNEKRAAKKFETFDNSFASNSGMQFLIDRALRKARDPNTELRLRGIEIFLDGESIPYRERFAYRVMARQEWDMSALDASQRLLFASVAIEGITHFKEPKLEPSLFQWGEVLLEWIGTGRQSFVDYMAPMFLRVVTDGYYTRKVEERGDFSHPQKLGVFALEMLAATRNETIDWDSYKIPTDRFWLECARTGLTEPDVDKCAQWMRDLCEEHMKAANVDGDTGGTDVLLGHEIDDPTHFLWPITVHAFIKLRRGLGLPIPEEVDHPLMRTSFASFAERSFDQKLWTPEPWFIEIFEIAESLEPDLAHIRDLVL